MKILAVLGLLVLLVVHFTSVVQSQTFQYSRGWTNGKRSGSTLPWADLLAEPKNGSNTVEADLGNGEDEGVIASHKRDCSADRENVIMLSSDRMLQLIAFSMRNHKFINVIVCMDPLQKNTHMHVDI